MSLSAEQYMALSFAAYSSLPQSKNPKTGLHWTVSELLSDRKIDNDSSLAASALPTLANYTLLAHQPNTSNGFSGAAFQAPNNPDGTKGEIIFAFRGTEPTAQNGVDITGADVQIATQRVFKDSPAQLESIKSFVYGVLATNTGVSYSFTGHSLGGG